MKDLRPQRDPRYLADLRAGAPSEGAGHGDVRRALRRRRITTGLLAAGALAVVIAPHLIDATRISSVAERAARQANAVEVVPLSCPASGGYPGTVNPPAPVALERAVVCHYPAGAIGTPPAMGSVPPSQLAALNSDLRAHSARSDAVPEGPTLGQPGRRDESWAVFGVTRLGQRVALSGSHYPSLYVWVGAGAERIWRPSAAVQQMLAADFPS
ncbi:MAG: hypothetical protein ACR2JU_12265 [Nocardioidaceae bacterium]